MTSDSAPRTFAPRSILTPVRSPTIHRPPSALRRLLLCRLLVSRSGGVQLVVQGVGTARAAAGDRRTRAAQRRQAAGSRSLDDPPAGPCLRVGESAVGPHDEAAVLPADLADHPLISRILGGAVRPVTHHGVPAARCRDIALE